MATVSVQSTSFTRAGFVITGQVTISVSFSESDVTSNMGFTPVLYVVPNHDGTHKVPLRQPGLNDMSVSANMSSVVLSDVTTEVTVPCKALLRPDGQSSLVTTLPLAVSVDDLFRTTALTPDVASKANSFFSAPALLDVRAELQWELRPVDVTASAQPITFA